MIQPYCPGIELVEKCPGLKATNTFVPKLSYENKQVLLFINKLFPWIFNGMGGYNYNVIDSAFNNYKIPDNQREVLLARCSIFFTAHAEVKSAEAELKKNSRGS